MSTRVETVMVAVLVGAETDVATRVKQPPVVDRGLVTELVGDARR